MCGLAGFAGVVDPSKREALAWMLGFGIDERGGDAAGFVTLREGEVIEGRKLGFWGSAKERFIRRACLGETTLMHARYATCGKKGVNEAHPFRIQRNGAPILWGAHNGMIWDAEESADANGREYSVDSKELFELLADGEIDSINDLTGYGVITWVEADNPGDVLACRMTSSGDFHAVTTRCGAIVWGSTRAIVSQGIQAADMTIRTVYEDLKPGTVYKINDRGMFYTERPKIDLASYSSRPSYSPLKRWIGDTNFVEADDSKAWADWCEKQGYDVGID